MIMIITRIVFIDILYKVHSVPSWDYDLNM